MREACYSGHLGHLSPLSTHSPVHWQQPARNTDEAATQVQLAFEEAVKTDRYVRALVVLLQSHLSFRQARLAMLDAQSLVLWTRPKNSVGSDRTGWDTDSQ